MNAADRVAAVVACWVATYSRHLPPEVAERRQAELASDLWEQRAWGGRWERQHRRWRSRSCGA